MHRGALLPRPPVPLHPMPWFHGTISRVEAESLLDRNTQGQFLLRTSQNTAGVYALAMRSEFRGGLENCNANLMVYCGGIKIKVVFLPDLEYVCTQFPIQVQFSCMHKNFSSREMAAVVVCPLVMISSPITRHLLGFCVCSCICV